MRAALFRGRQTVSCGFGKTGTVLAGALAPLLLAAALAPAVAGTSTFGPLVETGGSAVLTRSVTLGVDTTASTDATLSVTIIGDISFAGVESVAVTVDGVNVGTLTTAFDCTVETKTISIARATLAPLIADGQVVLSFTSTAAVDAFCSSSAPFSFGGSASFAVQGSLTFTAGASTTTTDAESVRRTTQSVIRNFMNNRADAIASSAPDGSRAHARLTGSLLGSTDGDAGDAPMGLGGPGRTAGGSEEATGPAHGRRDALTATARDRSTPDRHADGSWDAGDGPQRMSFSASLSRGIQSLGGPRDGDDERLTDGRMSLGITPATPKPTLGLPSAVDI